MELHKEYEANSQTVWICWIGFLIAPRWIGWRSFEFTEKSFVWIWNYNITRSTNDHFLFIIIIVVKRRRKTNNQDNVHMHKTSLSKTRKLLDRMDKDMRILKDHRVKIKTNKIHDVWRWQMFKWNKLMLIFVGGILKRKENESIQFDWYENETKDVVMLYPD